MKNKMIDHPSIVTPDVMSRICQPLQKLKINYFAHTRIDNKDNFSALCSSPGFLKHYIDNEYYNADIHMDKGKILGNYVLWDAIERCGLSEKMHTEAAEFGIQHTFTIINKDEYGSNCYHFANNSSCKSINQVYISNIDLLNKFIQYFNEHIRCNKDLNKAYDINFKVDYQKGEYSVKSRNDILDPFLGRKQFIEMIKFDASKSEEQKLIQVLKQCCSSISMREAQVLLLLIKGKSARAISEDLHLSCRTVEHYIINLKMKTGADSKMDLIGMFIEKLIAV